MNCEFGFPSFLFGIFSERGCINSEINFLNSTSIQEFPKYAELTLRAYFGIITDRSVTPTITDHVAKGTVYTNSPMLGDLILVLFICVLQVILISPCGFVLEVLQ